MPFCEAFTERHFITLNCQPPTADLNKASDRLAYHSQNGLSLHSAFAGGIDGDRQGLLSKCNPALPSRIARL